MQQGLQRRKTQLAMAARSLQQPQVALPSQRLASLRDAMARAQRARLEEAHRALSGRAGALSSVNPKAVLERGYAIVRNRQGEVLRAPGQAVPGEVLDVELAGGDMRVRVDPGT
jgi:exodeoxyribonuclease VII large subunit